MAFLSSPTSRLLLAALLAGCMPATASAAPSVAEGSVEPGSGTCSTVLGCHVVNPGFFDCDNSSITQALTRTPLAEIRVVAGSSAENVTISDRSLALVGGYASCADARAGVANPAGTYTTIDSGGSGLPTLRINNTTASPRLVALRNLVVSGTDGAAQGGLRIDGTRDGGGGLTLVVAARRLVVTDNVATNGGGVHLRDATLNLLDDIHVFGNTASQRGGGIHCQDATLSLQRASTVSNNTALLDGGGVYADNCIVELSGGLSGSVVWSESGLLRNLSELGSGGGLWAGGGSRVTIGNTDYADDNTSFISHNRANAFDGGLGALGGGGVYATGLGTEVLIRNTEFVGNHAGGEALPGAAASVGGAIAASTDASVRIERPGRCRSSDEPARYDGLCTRFIANSASGDGAAIHVFNATLAASGVDLQDQVGGAGGVLHFAGSGHKTVDTALLTHSTSFDATRMLRYAIRIESGNATLRSLTIADNDYTLAGIGSGIAGVDLRAVLVDDIRAPALPGLDWDSSAPPAAACVHLPDGSTLPPAALLSFTDAGGGWGAGQRDARDYRLKYNAFQVDACSTAQYSAFDPAQPDSDRQTRGFDAGEIDSGGPVDVGMDEFVPSDIFRDGFEAGLISIPVPIP